MKSFVLACMTALAVAETKEGAVVDMAQAKRDDVTMSGTV